VPENGFRKGNLKEPVSGRKFVVIRKGSIFHREKKTDKARVTDVNLADQLPRGWGM